MGKRENDRADREDVEVKDNILQISERFVRIGQDKTNYEAKKSPCPAVGA